MQAMGGNRDWERMKQLKSSLYGAYKAKEEFWRRKPRIN